MASAFEVLVVHGSYHTPAPYKLFIDALAVNKIQAHCPQLPSSDPTKLNLGDDLSKPDYERDPPPEGYPQPADDVKVVQALLRKLIIEEKKNVLLIGHSSGGFTATASAISELQAKTRQERGEKGGVIGIFYMCAFLIPVGESLHSFFQPKNGGAPVIPPWCNFHKNGLVTTLKAAEFLFNDLKDEEAKDHEKTLTASTFFTTILENDAYSQLPCMYLITKEDKALEPGYQEKMVALQNSRDEVDIKVVRCEAGHSPQLGWTNELVGEVKKFGEGILKG